jgi:hypothetical protein
MDYPRPGKHYPRSVGEFQARFRTDANCSDHLESLRWMAPQGATDTSDRSREAPEHGTLTSKPSVAERVRLDGDPIGRLSFLYSCDALSRGSRGDLPPPGDRPRGPLTALDDRAAGVGEAPH